MAKIFHNLEPGSDEWLIERAGNVCASDFGHLLDDQGKIKSSKKKGIKSYALRLAYEKVTKKPLQANISGLPAIAHGRSFEDDMADEYALKFAGNLKVDIAHLSKADDLDLFCTPDRLVGDQGLVELKTPQPLRWMHYQVDVEEMLSDYRNQALIQLEVREERIWCDIMAGCNGSADDAAKGLSDCFYHPPVIHRVRRSTSWSRNMRDSLSEIISIRDAAIIKIADNGFYRKW